MTELEIIKGCIRQNSTFQRLLYEQMAGKMFTVCLRYANDVMEAEDMMQEGFVRVFTYIYQFKFEGSFEGWVRRIMVNSALKYLQKKKIIFSEIKESDTAFSLHYYSYSHLEEQELLKLISNLPDGYRIVFNLYVIEGYSHEEIGQMLHIQPSTSRSQLVKARKMLQKQLIELEKIAV